MKAMRNPQEDILELLLVAQMEAGTYIPLWLQEELAQMLKIEVDEIKETIEFFSFLKDKKEKKCMELCMGSACYMAGNSINESILNEYAKDCFEIKYRTCEDACEYGPRVVVGDKTFHYVDENLIKDIIEYIKGEKI